MIFRPAIRLLSNIVAGICIACLVYILRVTDGNTWHAAALSMVKDLSLYTVLALLALTFTGRTVGFVYISGIVLILHFVLPLPGYLNCTMGNLSGGYDRYTNCGIDLKAKIGVLSGIGFLTMQGKNGLAFAGFTAALTVFVDFTADNHFRNALLTKLELIDLSESCIIRDGNLNDYSKSIALAAQITRIQDLNLGPRIGEQAPRVYQQQDTQLLVWSYANKEFQPSGANHLLEVCDSKQK